MNIVFHISTDLSHELIDFFLIDLLTCNYGKKKAVKIVLFSFLKIINYLLLNIYIYIRSFNFNVKLKHRNGHKAKTLKHYLLDRNCYRGERAYLYNKKKTVSLLYLDIDTIR